MSSLSSSLSRSLFSFFFLTCFLPPICLSHFISPCLPLLLLLTFCSPQVNLCGLFCLYTLSCVFVCVFALSSFLCSVKAPRPFLLSIHVIKSHLNINIYKIYYRWTEVNDLMFCVVICEFILLHMKFKIVFYFEYFFFPSILEGRCPPENKDRRLLAFLLLSLVITIHEDYCLIIQWIIFR